MSDIFGQGPTGVPEVTVNAGPAGRRAGRGRQRPWRIILVSFVSLFALLFAVAVGGYAYVNHMVHSIARIHVTNLTTARGVSGGLSGGALNVVLAGQSGTPGSYTPSGLIEILHLNSSQMAGGAVSIHPYTLVRVPGHGVTQIQNALARGGPSLLVKTITRLTQLRINHYARIDLPHVADMIDTIDGVNVLTSSGVRHFDGATAIAWEKDPSIGQFDRVLRQESLLRAVMSKILRRNLLTNARTVIPVLHSLVRMLTVDSNFTIRQLIGLARTLGSLSATSANFVIAPFTHAGNKIVFSPRPSHQLWQAVRQDAMRAWAIKHPQWRVPAVAP